MDQDPMPFIILIAFALNLFIFYFIIKGAVAAANKEMVQKLEILLRFKILELKKQGCSEEEIRAEVDKVYAKRSVF
jgi:hypothetical protein